MKRLVSIGECMLELSGGLSGTPTLSFGGDTLNTAVYAARCGAPDVEVAYLTALGDDPFSQRMVDCWQAEGIATTLVRRITGRLPGLYAIETDGAGERRFHYWRDQAAVRLLLLPEAEGDALLRQLAGRDMVYLSGITLAVLDSAQRARLFDALQTQRERGLEVAFDSNVRPALWPSLRDARAAVDAALACADIMLAGFDDERLLRQDDTPEDCARRLAAAGPHEVIVKNGSAGVWVCADGPPELIPAAACAEVVDTTAAGDSFNGAYLARRLQGSPPDVAAAYAARVASAVIGHRGALIPRDAMPA